MDRVQRKKDARGCPQASASGFFSSLVNQRASWDGPSLLAATASSTLDAYSTYIWQEQWCYASVGEEFNTLNILSEGRVGVAKMGPSQSVEGSVLP
jgi:hypothetical protein